MKRAGQPDESLNFGIKLAIIKVNFDFTITFTMTLYHFTTVSVFIKWLILDLEFETLLKKILNCMTSIINYLVFHIVQ